MAVWGKTDPKTNSYLPLVTHLEHAAAMAAHLWDSFFSRAIKELVKSDLRASEMEARALYMWFAGTHDVGKASVAFAQQAESVGMHFVVDRMRDTGLNTTHVPREDSVRHEVVSQLAIRDWLMAKLGAPRSAANSWSCVAGGHHGRNPSRVKLVAADKRPLALGTGAWADVRTEILDAVAEETGALPLLRARAQDPLPVRCQALVTSMVVVADWLASNQDLIPYRDALPAGERVAMAFESLALPVAWAPSPRLDDASSQLRQRFPDLGSAHARPIQEQLLKAAVDCCGPPLMILEAPMGGGKTEAAFLAAEALAARFGQGGVYFGLPTMATANPMFTRTLRWLESALGADDASVTLAHGKAGLNDAYAGMVRETWRGHVYDDEDADQGRPVVNDWLRGRRRAGLADFVVGTVDQGLFTALKAKYVALRHLGLAGKVVIIDEVHAADLYMREYLKRALTWLGAYHTPVILMSATLPPAQRDEYLAAYASGRGLEKPAPIPPSDAYPRITLCDVAVSSFEVADDSLTTEVAVETIQDDPNAISELLISLLDGGGCAGVICNTVARAQETYRALKAQFGSDVVLIHSRFVAPDRAQREAKLVAQLGRGSEQRPHRLVVVGTQVLEQSLDIDFDVMVTDLAPVDLVLQRAGRLHRHQRSGRPIAVNTPALYLRGVTDWRDAPPTPVRGSRSVYGTASLLRSAAVLKGRHTLTMPADIPSLVRRAYDPALQPPEGWVEAWKDAARRADRADTLSWMRAQSYLLEDPIMLSDLTGWLDVEVDDPERGEEQGRSQVRDSEDSLEVIALWRGDGGDLHLPACAPKHGGAIIPDGVLWDPAAEQSLARAMASCTLALPIQLTNPGIIDRAIADLERSVNYSCWQQSPWIRGQLAVVFDERDRTTLAGLGLHYSPDEGLVVENLEENS